MIEASSKLCYNFIICGGSFMLKIAICDDCSDFIAQSKRAIKNWPNKPQGLIIECFTDGDALIAAHNASSFDIILLDVMMPLINGIETAREIRRMDKNVKVVFLTSSPEFAVASYSVKANNYLLKPLNQELLYNTLDELLDEIKQVSRFIMIKSANAIHRVELESIEYIEAQNKRVLFVLSGERTIQAIEPLYTYESKLLLSDGFVKCHRSYIVNIHQIDSFTQREIKLRSGMRIPISRNCHKEFEEAYFLTLFGEAGEGS